MGSINFYISCATDTFAAGSAYILLQMKYIIWIILSRILHLIREQMESGKPNVHFRERRKKNMIEYIHHAMHTRRCKCIQFGPVQDLVNYIPHIRLPTATVRVCVIVHFAILLRFFCCIRNMLVGTLK